MSNITYNQAIMMDRLQKISEIAAQHTDPVAAWEAVDMAGLLEGDIPLSKDEIESRAEETIHQNLKKEEVSAKEAIRDYVKVLMKRLTDLPEDAEVVVCVARRGGIPDDKRIWVDILSDSYAKKMEILDEYGNPTHGEPVFEQYILVPSFRLQREAPEFWKKYYG